MRKKARLLRHVLILIFTGLLALLFAVPIIVTITNSFMSAFEIQNRYHMNILPANSFYRLTVLPQVHFVRMTIIPAWVTLQQYANLLRDVGYITALWNSLIITVPTVVGQVVISAPAAYAFEFSKWHHKEKLFFVYIVVMLMPLPVVLVPQFVMAHNLGISESVLAVILPAVFAPFGVFLLRQFMKTLPVEFIEAAKMDGAGQIRIMVSIVAPLLKPAISALALLVFIDYWNVVEQAIVFITDTNRLPLSVYITGRQISGNYSILFAASTFFMLPTLLVFLHGQEHLVEGMRMSGLK